MSRAEGPLRTLTHLRSRRSPCSSEPQAAEIGGIRMLSRSFRKPERSVYGWYAWGESWSMSQDSQWILPRSFRTTAGHRFESSILVKLGVESFYHDSYHVSRSCGRIRTVKDPIDRYSSRDDLDIIVVDRQSGSPKRSCGTCKVFRALQTRNLWVPSPSTAFTVVVEARARCYPWMLRQEKSTHTFLWQP